MGWLQGGKNLKEAPAYGADVLRLWVASVDYNSDVLIGDRILSQVLVNNAISHPGIAVMDLQSPTVSEPSRSCIGYPTVRGMEPDVTLIRHAGLQA